MRALPHEQEWDESEVMFGLKAKVARVRSGR